MLFIFQTHYSFHCIPSTENKLFLEELIFKEVRSVTYFLINNHLN